MKFNDRFNFTKYKNDKKCDNLSFASKFYYLKEFHDQLEKLKKIISI